jgi:hypothetical protein
VLVLGFFLLGVTERLLRTRSPFGRILFGLFNVGMAPIITTARDGVHDKLCEPRWSGIICSSKQPMKDHNQKS